MRRISALFAVVLMSGALALAAPAMAKPSERCGGNPVAAHDNGASVCVQDLGALTIAVNGNGTGYVVADGDDRNVLTQVSGCLDGFVGLQLNGEGNSGVVASGDGDYGFPAPTNQEPNPGAC